MFNLSFAKDYLLHRFKAKTRHGVHSPFVYRLVDKIIYDFNAKPVYGEIESVRKLLLNDRRMITITRAGTSHADKQRKKKISDIAKDALQPPPVAQLLYRLTIDLKPSTIIELGADLGITTLYLQKAAPGAKVYTLEPCGEIADVTKEVFKKAGGSRIELIKGNFDHTFPGILQNLDKADLVYINGNHQKAAMLKYFELCLPKAHDRTLLILSDIYRGNGMKETWEIIKAHPRVTVTVDLFWLGLVYFKKGQAKENFLIRI